MSERTRTLVAIVDDDAAVRDSLALLLGLRGYATREFASGDDFLAGADPSWRGCVLLDLRMTGTGGLDVLAHLAARGWTAPVIVLTAHGDAASARAALKGGAFDFVEKPFDDALLLATIEAATRDDESRRTKLERHARLRALVDRLTPREREVLGHVVAGRHNREIAAQLGISPRTVEVYKMRLMDKLQVERLPELIRLSLEVGLEPPA